MSDNFSVSVELKGKSTGVDQIEGVRTAILKIGAAAKETTRIATESARELGRAWSQSVSGDVGAKLTATVKAAQDQVDSLSARLKALYALKASGNPVANLSDAIRVASDDLEKAKEELSQLNSLTRITSTQAKALGSSLSTAFKGDVTQALRTGIGQARQQVESVTQKLKALYALRSTGNPVAGLKESIEQVEQELREAQYQLNQLNNTSSTATNLTEQMGVGGLVKGLLSAQVISLAIRESWLLIKNAVSSVVGEGLKMNEELEAFTLGIAANITAIYELTDASGRRLEGEEKYTQALEMSKKQMYELRKAGLATAATSQELGKSFQSALAVAGSSGIKDLEKIRQLTIGVANAATALVIPQEEAVVALRAIITGREVEQSTLARTLVTSGEQVRQWRAQGVLVDKLMEKLQPYTDAANRNANAWKVVKSNVEETFQVFSGELTSGLFGKLKELGLEFMGLLDPSNLGIVDRFGPLIAVLKNMFAGIGDIVVQMAHGALAALESLSTFIGENQKAIEDWLENAIKIWGVVKATLKNMIDIVSVVIEVGTALGAWQMALEAVKVILLGAVVAVAALSDGFRAIGTLVVTLGAMIGNSMLKPIAEFLREYKNVIAAVTPGVQASELENAGKRIQGVVAGLNASASDMWNQFKNGLPAINRLLDSFEAKSGKIKLIDPAETKKAIADIKAAISGLMGGDKKGDPAAAKRAAELAERVAKVKQEADLAFTKATLNEETKLLDDQLKTQEISITDYYTRLTQKQLAALEAERKIRQDTLAKMTGPDNEPERIRIQGELNVLKIEEGRIVEDNRIKQREALKELQNQVNDVSTQLKELSGTTTTDDLATNIALKFTDLRAKLVAQFGADSKNVSLLDEFIGVKTASESFKLIKDEYTRTLEEMQTKQAEIEAKQASGTLSPIDALNQLNQVQKDYTATLDALIPRLQEYADKVGSPELKAQLGELKTKVSDLKVEQNEFGKAMGDAIDSGWVQMWTDFALGTKTAEDAFKDFAKSILQTFTKLMTEIIAKAMMAKILEGMGSSAGGGWGSIFSSIFSGMAKADGGYISGPGTGTSDSIPARLSNGEYVIKAASVRRVGLPFLDALNGGKIKRGGHFFNEGGLAVSPTSGGDSSLTVGLEEGLVVKKINTPAGTKAVLRVIEDNPQFIRSLLS